MDNEQIHDDPNRVPDEPTIKETTWLGLVLAVGLISIPILLFLLAWTLEGSDQEALKRLEVLKLISAACVAIVTLLSVIWRGVVTTRQADQQFQQIEQQIRQNDAKDEENLAKLVIDGTKLVTDKDGTEATVLAGIAALETVITAPNSRFASHAMDILGEPIQNWFHDSLGTVMNASIRAINSGVDKGRSSKRQIYLNAIKSDWSNSRHRPLVAVNGFEYVKYLGGVFYDSEYSRFKDLEKVAFQRVEFDGCNSIRSSHYLECTFLHCKFSEFQPGKIWFDEITNCDFSGAKTVNHNKTDALFPSHQLKKLQDGENYYYIDNPPEHLPGIVWADYLQARVRQ